MTTCVQFEPPFVLTPATWPREPPFDQRSCCHAPTMLPWFAGLTSIQGSTSLFGTLVPVWPATLSGVHPANGEAPETGMRGPTLVKSPASAGFPTTLTTTPPATAIVGRQARLQPSLTTFYV